ncbi:hypothetical protein KSP40_PGU022148 [Platanthera guangdongensis]|uniref:Uncharacterized protein n=1 Tax=Platanthera guangdongensis TaxID=2320717 RepID=A0ABR2MGU0_9ASPA
MRLSPVWACKRKGGTVSEGISNKSERSADVSVDESNGDVLVECVNNGGYRTGNRWNLLRGGSCGCRQGFERVGR